MMNTKEIKRFVILNIPYVILGLLATNLGEAWETGCRDGHFGKNPCTVRNNSGAFGNPLPSMHPADLCVGICMRSRTEDCGLSPR